MALKDWKHEQGTLYSWFSKNNTYHIVIRDKVVIIWKQDKLFPYETRMFKTKSQALAFAKAYMRKN